MNQLLILSDKISNDDDDAEGDDEDDENDDEEDDDKENKTPIIKDTVPLDCDIKKELAVKKEELDKSRHESEVLRQISNESQCSRRSSAISVAAPPVQGKVFSVQYYFTSIASSPK